MKRTRLLIEWMKGFVCGIAFLGGVIALWALMTVAKQAAAVAQGLGVTP